MSKGMVAQESEPIDVLPEPEPGALVPFVAEAGALIVSRPPDIVLEEAHQAAAALTKVLESKPKKLVMNGEQYLEFEDWQTLGRFYGVTARAEDPELVEFGEVRGFRVKAVALDSTGREISAATAYCLNDEEKWSSRPKYEYLICLKNGQKVREADAPATSEWIWEPGQNGKNRPKKDRVLVGTEAVPFFQLASMAQTRACSKVLRNVLAWVVVMAGYRPTPAEELPTHEEPTQPAPPAAPAAPPIAEPRRKSEPAPAAASPAGPKPNGTLCMHNKPAVKLLKFYVCYLGPNHPDRCAFNDPVQA